MSKPMFIKRNPIGVASTGKNSSPPPSLNVAVAHIRVGSYYEIDASILPQRSPEQLKSIRIVMVSKITARNVSLRYPSMYSLRSHFDMNKTKPEKTNLSLLPIFDVSHAMEPEKAGELLYRRISPHELSTNRNSWSFWVSTLNRAASLEGNCWSELRSEDMIRWGRTLRVQYQKNAESSRFKEEDDDEAKGSHKRKLIESTTERLAQRTKVSDQNKETQIVVYKKKSDKKFIDRWSIERYKLAEKNMLKVMKEKNAVFGNTILRSALRSEARRLIGDTGLLDHLLKHMSGKVAPGGQDRFRRKHNTDGAMEYWLESSDLVQIRKEAGVEDPYWIPPPGWKLGDNPSQDPVCAGQIREIREGLASVKREFEKLKSKKEEDELVVVTTPNSCVSSQDHDNLMTPAMEIYADLLKKKYKVEDQLVIIGETLRQMEEDMGWLKKTVEDNCPKKLDSTETPLLLLEDSQSVKTLEVEVKKMSNEKQITESSQNREKDTVSVISKTGSRIFRPVGSFTWPKMPALADVSTESEIASLTSQRPSSPSLSPCLVKPLAAKGPLGVPFHLTVASSEADCRK